MICFALLVNVLQASEWFCAIQCRTHNFGGFPQKAVARREKHNDGLQDNIGAESLRNDARG